MDHVRIVYPWTLEPLSDNDQSVIFNTLTKEQRIQYLSSVSVGNFVYDLPDRYIIYDKLSYQGQRQLLMSMDLDKKISFIVNFKAPISFIRLSLDRITNLFKEIQTRVHYYRPNSIIIKENSIIFALPDYQSSVSIYETSYNYVIKESSLSNMVYKTLEENRRYRIPNDKMRIMETPNDVYEYLGSLDRTFLTTYGHLKTQLLFYTQYN
jgi:hypothetical protein